MRHAAVRQESRRTDFGEEMKKIGILGGMSPESTTLYYEHITRTYTAQHGDYGYPEILIYSVCFQKFVDWQRNGQWHNAAREMAVALERLRLAGADFGSSQPTRCTLFSTKCNKPCRCRC
jgi:hypothetical protein